MFVVVIRWLIRAHFRWHPCQRATPLAHAHSVPPKQASTSVDSAQQVAHRLLAGFCLICSARARRVPAVRARGSAARASRGACSRGEVADRGVQADGVVLASRGCGQARVEHGGVGAARAVRPVACEVREQLSTCAWSVGVQGWRWRWAIAIGAMNWRGRPVLAPFPIEVHPRRPRPPRPRTRPTRRTRRPTHEYVGGLRAGAQGDDAQAGGASCARSCGEAVGASSGGLVANALASNAASSAWLLAWR